VVTTFTQIASPQPFSTLESEDLGKSQYLLDTLENISDAFCALDREWRITYINAQAAQLLNCSSEDLLGKNHWEKFPET
jgi:PAS domain S-box-containing protein